MTDALFTAGKVQQFRFKKPLCEELNNHAAIIHSTSKTDVIISYIDSLKRKQNTPPQNSNTPQSALPSYPSIKETVFCRFKGCLVTKESCRALQKTPQFEKVCATVKNPLCKEIVFDGTL